MLLVILLLHDMGKFQPCFVAWHINFQEVKSGKFQKAALAYAITAISAPEKAGLNPAVFKVDSLNQLGYVFCLRYHSD
jgi:hypothetical protein